MKKLLLSLFAFGSIYNASAQLVNGDFESAATPLLPGIATQTAGWGTGLYTIETTGAFAGNQSVKMTTIVNAGVAAQIQWPSDTIPGFIQQVVNGPVSNAANLTLNFAYKNNTVAGDSAVIQVGISDTLLAGSSDDVLMYVGGAVYTGTTSSWTLQSIPLQENMATGYTANQIFFIAASSIGPFTGTGNGFPNSVLELDNISLTASSSSLNELENIISVYPNPANDVLNIKADGEISNVTITTLDGKVVSSSSSSVVNVAELTAGMYIYQVTVDGKVSTGNFVKN
jgi:hypothetical protein